MRHVVFASIVFALFVGGSAVLDACGDKFLMVGRGLTFGRAYASIYPGNILIYSGPRTSPLHEKMQLQIRRAGHRVTLVADEAALLDTLSGNQTDIVIADVAIKATLDSKVATVPTRPTTLYIVNETDKGAAAMQKEAAPLKSGDKANRFLMVIEEAMKSRAQTGVRIKRG